ncbi:hypothetical protein DFQ28_009112, partial [Apophysomyces sp. BC1034]
MTFEWVYASGAIWVPFDTKSQQQIEDVWRHHTASYIYIGSFRAEAYVNGPGLYVHFSGSSMPIARRC